MNAPEETMIAQAPACACPVLSAFLRAWGDGLPDDATRTRLLAPLIPRLAGSRSTPAVEVQRSYLALDWLIRVHTPAWLALVPSLRPHAAALRALPEITDAASATGAQATIAAARTAGWDAVTATACDAAWNDTWDAARDTALAAARAAAWAAARDTMTAAARAVVRDAARNAAWAAVRVRGWDALAPTVATLQQSAQELVKRMLACGEAGDARRGGAGKGE